MKNTSATYARAGVDIAAGDALVSRIGKLAKATRRKGVMGGIGGFGALFDLKAAKFNDPVLVSSTDGVGTKLKIAQAMNRHDTIGIDLVAMCVNDLVVQGAEPLFFLDYFATGTLKVGVAADVVRGVAGGCKEAGCALVGGETAEMPGMYASGEYDLAGFAVGAVERKNLLPKANVKKGDVILGLASSGVHSNGYSLVRHLVEKEKLSYGAKAPFAAKTLGDALLTPTRIYVKPCLKAVNSGGVKALAHITGGGLLENIPRVLPKNLAAQLDAKSWKPPPVFDWLREAGNISPKEMYRTFNCGIGMALVAEKAKADKIAAILKKEGERVFVIGEIAPRKGASVVIHD